MSWPIRPSAGGEGAATGRVGSERRRAKARQKAAGVVVPMPLVAIDSNIIDMFVSCTPTVEHAEASEAWEFPPDYETDDPRMRRELFACFWLRSLASAWRSTLYTFSDKLYAEVALAETAPLLLTLAMEAREDHPQEYRVVDEDRRPVIDAVAALGLDPADAQHVADAVGLGCDVFLTNDRRLRNRSSAIERGWGLRVRRPSEFLVEAVRAGAPWPASVAWPWEVIEAFAQRKEDS
jgi:hypothetical protein